MRKEILDTDTDYFEKIDITFIIKKRNDRIIINYIINGKYRRAYLGDFYLTDYYDMATSPTFEEDFKIYTLLLIEDLELFLFD